MLRRKVFSILLTGALLLSSFLSLGVPKAEALDLTQESLISLSNTIVKIRSLSQAQAQQAITIAQTVINNNNSWLSSGELDRLQLKGLTISDINTVLSTVSTAVNTNWGNLTNANVSTQLNAASNLINEVTNNLSTEFKSNLQQRGLTSGDLASLIASSISLVGVQISSWDNLPQSEINAIFDNFITNTSLSREIVESHGLNWTNVQEILNSLDPDQKSQLQSILVSLGSWPATTVVSTATNAAGNKIIITLNKSMADPAGKHGEFTVLVNGAPNAVTAAALDSLSTKKIVLTLTNSVASVNTVTLSYTAGTVKSADGVALPSFSGRTVTVLVPISTPAVTVTETNKNLAVTAATDDVTITVPSTVTDATINVAELLAAPAGGTVTTAPMPAELKIEASTTISDVKPVEISIPAGTTISAADSDNWDGTINVPTVKANNTVEVTPDAGKTATVNAVIELGFNDVPLTFSKAVRILIPGQAGKDAGYYRGTTFTKITTVLNADTQAAGDALPAGQDGKIDVGTDLVIWTKHFTKFIAYTQTSSGGGGGGGPMPSSEKTIDIEGGKISQYNAVINFPAGAVASQISIKIEKVSDTSGLPVPVNSKLVSDVVNITKDKSGDFVKPVTITLTFDKTLADSEKYNISIYWLDESANKWIKLDNIKVDPAAGTVSGDINHFTKFAVMAEEKPAVPPLKDIAGHWASASISRLVQSGAIKGYADGTFKPDNNITRAEFATVLVKAFKLEPKTGRVFTDTAAHWAKDNIATASAYGIVSGFSDTTFGPDQLITREQMAVMVVKAARLATPLSNGTSFTDSRNISVWAAGSVAVAVMNNVIKGYPDNTFRPQGKATRAEAVTVISNAMK